MRSETNLAGSVTPHHLMINRNHLLVGGVRPHYYCLPIVKRERHREALVEAVTAGDPRFFLGTDSAPHTREAKESACGCAGVFNAANTLACLATVFEEADALDRLEHFASLAGPAWYGLEAERRTRSRSSASTSRCRRRRPSPSATTRSCRSIPPAVHWRVRDAGFRADA